jgi:uncharacterized membrane protein
MNNQSSETPKTKKLGAIVKIRNKIFVGVILATPIMATIWIFNFLLRAATSWFPRHYFAYLDSLLNGYLLQILVLVFVLFMFYVIGLFAHYFLGKRLYHLADKLFSGIPFIKNIYIFVRQVCEWVAKSHNSMFEAVVLVEYPRKGCYAVGLVTAQTMPSISSKILDENGQSLACVNVFISTTPNPTSGIFLIYPERDVIRLDMDVADAINLVISAGAILPEKSTAPNRNPLLDMIDALVNKADSPDTPDSAP